MIILLKGSWYNWKFYGPAFFWGPSWSPANEYAGTYGAAPFIIGTLATAAIALLIAVPISIGIAIFLSEHAPVAIRTPLISLVELLAAVPSVVFGFWGLEVLAPLMGRTVIPWLGAVFGHTYFRPDASGLGLLTAGVVLSIMIIPTISALSREALMAVPQSQREAALSLGATKWETTRTGVLKHARSGIAAGIILGLGRAVGETMAVLMVIGSVDTWPVCISCHTATLSTVLALEFTDPTGPADAAALLALGVVLFTITLAINVGARLLLWRLGGRAGSPSGSRGRWFQRGRGRALLELEARGNSSSPVLARSEAAAPALLWSPRVRWGGRGVVGARPSSRLGVDARRRAFSRLMIALALVCVVIALVPLGDIILTSFVNGGRVLSLPFLTGQEYWASCTLGVNGCSTGGIGPAIEDTLLLMGLASLIAIPGGVLAAIFLSEFCAGGGRVLSAVGRSISFFMDVMSGIPTIVTALFIWTIFFLYNPFQSGIQSTVAQSLALGVIMIPIVTRTSEEALRMVPQTLREAAWGLGSPRFRTTGRIVLRTGAAPLMTGSLLAAARAGGETAPFLFLGYSRLFPFQNCTMGVSCLRNPGGPLGILIYQFGIDPGTNNIAAAWGASLVFIIMMLGISVTARLLLKGKSLSALGGA